MEFGKRQIISIIGIAGTGVTIISVILWYLSARVSTLSYQITTGQNILPTCGFSEEEFSRIMETLLNAEKKLHIESNYDAASQLYNSVSSGLWSCEPKLQVPEPIFMLLTILFMILIFFLLYGFTRRFVMN